MVRVGWIGRQGCRFGVVSLVAGKIPEPQTFDTATCRTCSGSVPQRSVTARTRSPIHGRRSWSSWSPGGSMSGNIGKHRTRSGLTLSDHPLGLVDQLRGRRLLSAPAPVATVLVSEALLATSATALGQQDRLIGPIHVKLDHGAAVATEQSNECRWRCNAQRSPIRCVRGVIILPADAVPPGSSRNCPTFRS